MYVCMYVCMHVFMYVCMYVCMYACMYVGMYPPIRSILVPSTVHHRRFHQDRSAEKPRSSSWGQGMLECGVRVLEVVGFGLRALGFFGVWGEVDR